MKRDLEHIDNLSEENLLQMLTFQSHRRKLKISSALTIENILSNRTARNVMTAFAPTHAKIQKGQFDSSNLKAVLINCKTYSGWVNLETSDGWLQSFHVVAKMRNEEIGHNNAHRLRKG